MRIRAGDLRRMLLEALVAEEEIHGPACSCEGTCGCGEKDGEEVEEMTTVANIGIMGYPTPGPFVAFHMPPRKRVIRRRSRPVWNGRIN